METSKPTIVIPICGESSRYPGDLPKWAYKLPNGMTMLEACVSGLDIQNANVEVYYLSKHRELIQKMPSRFNFFELTEKTQNQAETIKKGLNLSKTSGIFSCRDCDSFFRSAVCKENNIYYSTVSNLSNYPLANKSFITKNSLGKVTNIVEKKIISDKICCGLYSFSSTDQFLYYYDKVERLATDRTKIYISDIIFQMLLDGHLFSATEVKDYIDWGTIEEWKKYVDNISPG